MKLFNGGVICGGNKNLLWKWTVSLVVLCLVGEKMMENEGKSWLMSVPYNNPHPGRSLGVDCRRAVALTRLSWRWLRCFVVVVHSWWDSELLGFRRWVTC